MIFYKLCKIYTTDNNLLIFLPLSQNLMLFDSNTILTSFMTSQIVMVNFFPYKGFFLCHFHV
jgi:hypothetical protein